MGDVLSTVQVGSRASRWRLPELANWRGGKISVNYVIIGSRNVNSIWPTRALNHLTLHAVHARHPNMLLTTCSSGNKPNHQPYPECHKVTSRRHFPQKSLGPKYILAFLLATLPYCFWVGVIIRRLITAPIQYHDIARKHVLCMFISGKK